MNQSMSEKVKKVRVTLSDPVLKMVDDKRKEINLTRSVLIDQIIRWFYRMPSIFGHED